MTTLARIKSFVCRILRLTKNQPAPIKACMSTKLRGCGGLKS